MKKGNFLTGKNLGTTTMPTPDAIRELNQQLVGKTVEAPPPPAAEVAEQPPASPDKIVERKVRITIDIPESLHEALKIYTFRRKTTMKDLFLEHVASLVAAES